MIDHNRDDNNFTPMNTHTFSIDRNDDYEVLNQDNDYIDRDNNNRYSLPFISIGLLIIVLPFIIAFITSLYHGVSMFNEGTGTGVYLLFIIITIPCGLLIIIIAIISRLIRYFRRHR